MRWKPRQKLAIQLPIVRHAQCLTGVTLFVHRDEHRKLLVSIAPDKLFHIAASSFTGILPRSLREIPLQRFHSIIIGVYSWCRSDQSEPSGVLERG
jgi:hypothetical protein